MTAARKYDYRTYFQKLSKRLQRNLRDLREAKNLTIEEAARRSGIHRRHWQKIEAGETNIEFTTIIKLANGLRVKLDELFAFKPSSGRKMPASKRSVRKNKSARPQVRHSRARK